MSALTYSHRKSVLAPALLYSLQGATLQWSDDNGGSGSLNLADIVKVNLLYDPTRFERNRFRTNLQARSGKSVLFTNMAYRGVADFEDQSAAYVAFVRGLHARLAAQAGEVDFSGGSSPTKYLLYWLLTIFVVVMLIAASIWFFMVGLSWLSLIKLAIACYYIPTLFAFMKRVKPRSYQPDNIPADLLPAHTSEN